MRKLKVGILGCGRIAELRHAPEYADNDLCEICGFYDINTPRAKALADAFGGTAYMNRDDFLQSDIDAVSVCTANMYHAADTVDCLNAGKHVLCEKPMAVTLDECENMTETSKRTGKRLMIGLNQRFNATHVKAREMILSGDIGRPLTFHTRFAHPGPEVWTGTKNTWFFDKNVAVFGAMADLGVHKVDLAHYLLSDHVKTVTAFAITLDKKTSDGELISVDDNCMCILEMRSGALGELHAGWTNNGCEDNSMRVYGTKGALKLFCDPKASLILERDGECVLRENPDELLTNAAQLAGKRVNTGVIGEFVSAILENRESRIDALESIYAMRVMFAAAKSAVSGSRENVQE